MIVNTLKRRAERVVLAKSISSALSYYFRLSYVRVKYCGKGLKSEERGGCHYIPLYFNLLTTE